MARRKQADQQQIRALAREALDRVEDAEDAQAEAERVFREVSDPRVRRAVAAGAPGEPGEVARAVLAAAIRSGQEEVARTAAEMVVDLSGTPAGRELLKECFHSEAPDLRRRAVEALESFSQPDLVDHLAEALTDEADPVWRSAAGTFGIIIGTPSHGLRRRILEELSDPEGGLAVAVLENPNVSVRRQVAQAMSFVDSELVLPTLRALSQDQTPEVRQEAVLSLAAIGTEEAVRIIAERLEDPSYRVVSSVLDMLAASLGGSSEALLEQLRRALDHELAEVRRHAVLMLHRYEPSHIREVLERAAGDPDFEVSREAGEMLRSLGGVETAQRLTEEMSQQVVGQRVRTVWEAGNIAQESGAGSPAATEEKIRSVLPALEYALRRGSPSEKVHALNELSSLVDIGESEAMQEALNDPDSSVRSRAADTFSYTHDAGLLVDSLESHSDPLVRRRAVEALGGNPGGPRERGRLATSISFTSARTAGVNLYSYYLLALSDPDSGVQQLACEAVRECARRAQLVPVKQTLAELEELAADEETSALLEEDADHAADLVRQITFPETIAEGVEKVLGWRGRLAREAHSLRADPESGGFEVNCSQETVERWAGAFGLDLGQAEQLSRAASAEEKLPAEPAAVIMEGLTRELSVALRAVAHAARALRLIGLTGREENLEKWASAVKTGPRIEWGGTDDARALLARLRRLRRRAWIQACAAREHLRDNPDWEFLEEALQSQDDWVEMTAQITADELDHPAAQPERLEQLCRERRGDTDFLLPVGLGGVRLLLAGRRPGIESLKSVLEAARVNLRLELVYALSAAAQRDKARSLLNDYLEDRTLDGLPDLCLALAARSAGAVPEGMQPPEPPDGLEEKCAALALRAMGNETEAAEQLETMLRSGGEAERYLSAGYLGLARVWTAVLVFSSVRDQDVRFSLRLRCASSLTRCGHPGGLSWFEKVSDSVSGRAEGQRVLHLCRAVEDTIPLMLECRDVNVGRFV